MLGEGTQLSLTTISHLQEVCGYSAHYTWDKEVTIADQEYILGARPYVMHFMVLFNGQSQHDTMQNHPVVRKMGRPNSTAGTTGNHLLWRASVSPSEIGVNNTGFRKYFNDFNLNYYTPKVPGARPAHKCYHLYSFSFSPNPAQRSVL